MSTITLSDGTTTLDLGDMRWLDRLWSPVRHASVPSLTGALLLDVATLQAGRPITLQGGEGYGWLTGAQLEQLLAWAALPEAFLTLSLDGQSREVVFDHAGEGAIRGEPLFPAIVDPDEAQDQHLLTLRFVETIPPSVLAAAVEPLWWLRASDLALGGVSVWPDAGSLGIAPYQGSIDLQPQADGSTVWFDAVDDGLVIPLLNGAGHMAGAATLCVTFVLSVPQLTNALNVLHDNIGMAPWYRYGCSISTAGAITFKVADSLAALISVTSAAGVVTPGQVIVISTVLTADGYLHLYANRIEVGLSAVAATGGILPATTFSSASRVRSAYGSSSQMALKTLRQFPITTLDEAIAEHTSICDQEGIA